MRADDLVWTKKRVKEVSPIPNGEAIVKLAGVSGTDERSRMLPDHPQLPAVARWLASDLEHPSLLRSVLRAAGDALDLDEHELNAVTDLYNALRETS